MSPIHEQPFRLAVVLMSVYKGDRADHLREAIVSVLNQKLPVGVVMRIYLAVDGPIDHDLESVVLERDDRKTIHLVKDRLLLDHLDHAPERQFYGGKLGIDATAKWPEEGARPWPEEIEMSDDVKNLVSRRWQEYGIPRGN